VTREELWHGLYRVKFLRFERAPFPWTREIKKKRSLLRENLVLSPTAARPGQENRQEKRIIICTFLTYRTELSRTELNWLRRPCRAFPCLLVSNPPPPLPVPFVRRPREPARWLLAPSPSTPSAQRLVAAGAIACFWPQMPLPSVSFSSSGARRALLIGTSSFPAGAGARGSPRQRRHCPPCPGTPRRTPMVPHGSCFRFRIISSR